jgi:glycosyltransferase involved in cell wall biosynthesis
MELLTARGAGSRIFAAARHADVVHVHGVWRAFNVAAAQSAIKADCKLIIAAHGMLDPWSLRQHSFRKRLLMRVIWRRILDRASFVHALNRNEAEGIERLGLATPVQIFPNGVFPEQFGQVIDPELFRAKVPTLRGRPYVLFLSRLHYKKGLDYLAAAFGKFALQDSDTDLVIAGPDDGAAASLPGVLEAAGITQRTHLVGPLHGNEKLAALRGARCLCLPSRQEGFSMVLLESLASGTPVVISKSCNFPEVGEKHAGTVVDLDAAAICDALLLFSRDDVLRDAMGAAGKKMVGESYDWLQIAASMVRGYASGR